MRERERETDRDRGRGRDRETLDKTTFFLEMIVQMQYCLIVIVVALGACINVSGQVRNDS